MALSGIPVSADCSCTFPLVNEILVDIGDEQSIESSLSTFSAHVSKISEILERADSKTIVLVDELGTGTEPVQGSAIACSVLKDLKEKGSLVFATTHLTDIVGFVHKTDGMVNASMEFDQKTLTPLYRLKVGEPGESHALEIARRYGLPERIIDFAKKMLGTIEAEFHSLIADLKEKRVRYEEALKEVKRKMTESEEKEKLLKERLAEAEKHKKDILEKAYEEAHTIISNTKRQVYAILEEAKRKKSRDAIKSLEKTHKEIDEKLRESRKEPSLSIDEMKEGDVVFVRSIGYDVKVVKIDKRHNRLWVKAGSIDVEVHLSDIGPKKGKAPESKKVIDKITDEEEAVPLVLNIVGLRVDDALSALERFLNHASMAGIGEVTVVHGIGKGVLIRAVSEYLTGHPLAKQFRSGEVTEGERGVTVVTMK
jgi:DNA mismatch repair protein MutS2